MNASPRGGVEGVLIITNMRLCLGKLNFIIMGIAAVMIIVGFALTAGEPSTPEHFNPDVFSDTRVVYGPNICFIGYLLMIVGICVKSPRRNGALADASAEKMNDENNDNTTE